MRITPPLYVSVWTVVIFVLGAGVGAAGWPGWAVGLLGVGCLALGFGVANRSWRRLAERQEDIQTGLRQLQQIADLHDTGISVSEDGSLQAGAVQQATARLQARLAYLEEERAKIVAVVENLVEGVLAFDPKGKILFSNPSARRILGLEALQLQGLTLWEVIRNQELAELVEGCQHLALHETRRAEVELHTPSPMVMEIYALPVPFSKKKKGCVLVLHDVTELRRLEQVRAEFIDNVSHELRTPLAAIVGYLETLRDEPSLETPTNRRFVEVAHHHAERLTRLVNDLRGLSEIESGKVILRREAIRLGEVVEEVCEMFAAQVQKKQLEFHNQVTGEIRAWTDRDRVIQVLVNLVDNAVKYTPSGGTISFSVRQGGAGHLALLIQDTGPGIPSTDLPRITERFYRVDRARSREEGGTGLGLSIVKHLMQLLGGKLHIKSEMGKGTTVEIDLPCYHDPT